MQDGLVRRPLAALAMALLLALAIAPARAVPVADLYQAEVGATGLSQAEVFVAALSEVLVRVTGRRDAANLPGAATLLEDAGRYVRSYRRTAGGRLAVAFEGDAIETALAAAGMPYWGGDRPTTEVWLAIDRGGGATELVTTSTAAAERAAVEAAAALRGLPLRWPAGAESRRERLEQVWAGDVATLAAAARDAGVSGVLVGRARRTPTGFIVDWDFAGAGSAEAARGGLDSGVHLAADRYAAVYASAAGAQPVEFTLRVAGIATADDFIAASSYLQSLSAVRDVGVTEVGPDAVSFLLTVRGEPAALRRALDSDRRLLPESSVPGDFTYRWRP